MNRCILAVPANSTPMTCTALIVEDHPLYRDALRLVLRKAFEQFKVLTAASAEEGLRLAKEASNLQLVLLDVCLPGLSGIEALTAFRASYPATVFVMLSASDDRREVTAAFRAGAKAFISKNAAIDLMADTLQQVLSGQVSEPVWIGTSTEASFDASSAPELTTRQLEILSLLSDGHSNKEISLRLDLAEVTVKQHVSSLFRILNVINRTQAVIAARRLGLLS